MSGWSFVAAVTVIELTALLALILKTWRRGLKLFLIVALAVMFLMPVSSVMTGDISRLLPAWVFSSGADGKDQIIVVSAVSTLALPLTMASVLAHGFFPCLSGGRRRDQSCGGAANTSKEDGQ